MWMDPMVQVVSYILDVNFYANIFLFASVKFRADIKFKYVRIASVKCILQV